MSKTKAARPHDEWLRAQLKNRKFTAEYLNAAAEDEDVRVYVSALRNVAEVQGMAKVAEAAGMPRESLYRALSLKGNPRLSTLAAILKAAKLKLTVAT